ncbi:hypothetical protein H5410_028215 [Solanum commersonii]|uniref:DUF4283 domain-containing protein n=1 Tax=Solanum commersonii TaxID=4109 RepID=A0A9J5Z1A6_SOLCO|nr:hypothetical protein H5410_028215 [Solanum commersonii]
MENSIAFRMGGKVYDITSSSAATGEWYEWVETTRLSVRNMVLSKDALLWLCKRFSEASVNRGKSFKSWRCQDVSTYIYCSQKFNKYGRFMSVISVNGHSRTIIIIPENTFNEGWGKIAGKIESFINLISRTKAVNTAAGGFISKPFTGNGNYKGAVTNNKWIQQIQAKAPMKNCLQEENTLLRRCLVGRFSGGDEAPTRNDVRRWANQTWKGVLNLQVYDLNGFLFLFEFQTRRDAEQILMGEWRRQGHCLNLEWWSPTTCALPETFRFEWFWIRVLGLPLHLWNSKMMKEIGDACGGWLENEEETELKNHLRWARIRVRGPKEKIPTSIEVADGDLIYTLPIWCELPALYRKKQEVLPPREVEIEPGFRSSNILAQWSEALHKNGRLADGAGTSKLDVYEKGGNSADRNHVAGHVKFLNSQDHWVCPRNYRHSEPVPIQIDSSNQERDVEATANEWVQANMISLSQHFGIDLKGCQKEAYALLMKLDQRTGKEKMGLNGENKRELVRKLLKQWGADIIVLVETKLNGHIDNILQSIWNNRWAEVLMKEAQGSSGGIMILWDKRVWRGELLLVGSQCLTGKFSGIHDDFNWCITAVYADCDTVIRRVLWQELLQMKTSINGPWVVCGDFNVTRFASERTNCNRQNGAMTEFSSCIEDLEMVDPPLFGGSFTWRRGEDHNCASRIDRFLHCAEWGENFTQINQCSLPKIASDHNPNHAVLW